MKFEYTAPAPGALSGKPLVQIALYSAGHEICVSALVDSGAAITILPYDMGLQLGFVWEEQTMPVRLGGMLAGVPAVAVLVRGEVSALFPTALAMAWVKETRHTIRPVLGQLNFFRQYKVTFEGYDETFGISSKPS